jgi:hypothetical protein
LDTRQIRLTYIRPNARQPWLISTKQIILDRAYRRNKVPILQAARERALTCTAIACKVDFESV